MKRKKPAPRVSRRIVPFMAADLTTAPDGTLAVAHCVLAARLGFRHPGAVRRIIDRTRDTLEAFGPLDRDPGTGAAALRYAPRRGGVILLNRHQALMLTALSGVPWADRAGARLAAIFNREAGVTEPEPAIASHPVPPYPRPPADPVAAPRQTGAGAVPASAVENGVLFGFAAIGAYLGLAPQQVRGLVSRWGMPVRRGGPDVWIPQRVLDQWLATTPPFPAPRPADRDTQYDLFLSGHVVADPEGQIPARALYRAFQTFAAAKGLPCVTEVRFAREMAKRIGRSAAAYVDSRNCNAYFEVRLVTAGADETGAAGAGLVARGGDEAMAPAQGAHSPASGGGDGDTILYPSKSGT